MALSEISKSGEFKQEIANIKHNNYNLSRAWYGTGTTGAKIPVDIVELIPNAKYRFNYDVIIRNRYPLKKPIRNNVRAYCETYVCKLSDLWEDGENFISKGIRRDKELKIPAFLSRRNLDQTDPFSTTVSSSSPMAIEHCTPNSPLNYMGFPWRVMDLSEIEFNTGFEAENYPMDRRLVFMPVNPLKTDSEGKKKCNFNFGSAYTATTLNQENQELAKINALPLVMYEKIHIKESNQNLLIDNKYMYPDHMEDLRIKSDYATRKNGDGESGKGFIDILDPSGIPIATRKQARKWLPVDNNNTNYPSMRGMVYGDIQANGDYENGNIGHLNTLRFDYFPNDYFNTASIWADLIRKGETLPSVSTADLGRILGNNITTSFTKEGDVVMGSSTSYSRMWVESNGEASQELTDKLKQSLNAITNSGSIKAKQLRSLMAETVMLEAIGTVNRTDYYNGFMQALYGTNPKSNDYMPVKIGGFYGDMITQAVTNTAGNTENNTLGEIGANAKIAMSGTTGSLYTTSFGYAMTLIKIIPNVIYSKMIERLWHRQENADFFNPALEGTEPEAIMRYEISNIASSRNDVFGFVKRNQQYKQRMNIQTGIAQGTTDKNNGNKRVQVLEDMYYMKRLYYKTGESNSNNPTLNNYFITCCPDTLKCSSFIELEDEWDIMVGCNVTAQLPIGEEKPATFGMGN